MRILRLSDVVVCEVVPTGILVQLEGRLPQGITTIASELLSYTSGGIDIQLEARHGNFPFPERKYPTSSHPPAHPHPPIRQGEFLHSLSLSHSPSILTLQTPPPSLQPNLYFHPGI